MGLDRVTDRPPHLNDGEATREKLVGLVGQEVAYALRPRPLRIVVVHAANDLADLAALAQLVVGGAQRVIEHHHARGPALGLHQGFHLGVVDAAHLALVEEVDDPGVVADEAKAVPIERKPIPEQACIADGDAARVRRPAGAHIERTRTTRIGEQLLAVVDDIVDRRLDRLGDGFLLDHRNHGKSSFGNALLHPNFRRRRGRCGGSDDIGSCRGRHNRRTDTAYHNGAAGIAADACTVATR